MREIAEHAPAPQDLANLNRQVAILHRRAAILRLSITLAASTVLFVGLLILGLFVAALWQVQLAALLVLLFCAAVLGLIGSMLAFLVDMNLSLEAARLDWQLIGRAAN